MNQTHNVETRRTNLEKEKNIMTAKENHDLQEFTELISRMKTGIIKIHMMFYLNLLDIGQINRTREYELESSTKR